MLSKRTMLRMPLVVLRCALQHSGAEMFTSRPPHGSNSRACRRGCEILIPHDTLTQRSRKCPAAVHTKAKHKARGHHSRQSGTAHMDLAKLIRAARGDLQQRRCWCVTQSRNLPTEFFSLHISPHGVRLERCGLFYRVLTC